MKASICNECLFGVILFCFIFFITKDLFLFYVSECFVRRPVCTPCVCSTGGGQKLAAENMGLELQMIMSVQLGSEN